MKVVLRCLGILAACLGILFSVNIIDSSQKIEIPAKYVYVSSSSSAYDRDWSYNTGAKYLGGDAYNYIIEASLKAGYYNATVMTKTVKETTGTVLLFLSVFFLLFSLYSLQNCLSASKMHDNTVRDNYQNLVLEHLQSIENGIVAEKQSTNKAEANDSSQNNISYVDL